MARATREDGIVKDLPKGMKLFTVVGPTIKDSTGAYCTDGQQAALNRADATKYHKLHLIQAALDFSDEEANTDDAGEPTVGEGAKAATVAGTDSGKTKA